MNGTTDSTFGQILRIPKSVQESATRKESQRDAHSLYCC